eukprot:735077_1
MFLLEVLTWLYFLSVSINCENNDKSNYLPGYITGNRHGKDVITNAQTQPIPNEDIENVIPINNSPQEVTETDTKPSYNDLEQHIIQSDLEIKALQNELVDHEKEELME